MHKNTRYLLIFLSITFLLLTFLKSFYFSQKNGGTDLRTRIVASRILATEHSPYFYKWNPFDGDFFLDPNDTPARLVNGNVVTPAVLYLIYPISQLSYSSARSLWTVLQLIAALAVVFLLFKKQLTSRIIPFALITLGLICTDTFLYHVERGQMYIFYAFIFALMYYPSNATGLKYNNFITGFIGGLFIFFRPFAAIVGLPFFIAGKQSFIKGWLSGLVVGCLLFVVPNPSLWLDYLKAMQEYSSELLGKGHRIIDAVEYSVPAVVEGMDNLDKAQGFNISGLNALPNYLIKIGLDFTAFGCMLFYGIIVLVLLYFFFGKKSEAKIDTQQLFLFGFLLYMLAELLLLTPRGTYNVVQWIFPLSLICLHYYNNKILLMILGTAFLLLHNFPFVIPFQSGVAELIFLSTLVYILFFQKKMDSLNYTSSQLMQSNTL